MRLSNLPPYAGRSVTTRHTIVLHRNTGATYHGVQLVTRHELRKGAPECQNYTAMTVIRMDFGTKHATSVFGSERGTVDEAYPGDVVGLVNARDLRIGDTLYEVDPVVFPPIPTFDPEVFASVRPADTGRFKQFRSGLQQLDEEGVVQVLRDPDLGDQAPILAAVGQLQFDVFAHRLEHEFGAPVSMGGTPYNVARKTNRATADQLRGINGVRVMHRKDGGLVALFESKYWLDRLISDHPDYVLTGMVSGI